MNGEILQSTTWRVPLKAYLSSDHISAATGKTIAVLISQNMGTFSNPSAGATNATELGNGWYYVDLSTTDTGTLGPLIVRCTASGVDDVEEVYRVVKATNRGMSGIPDATANANGGLPILSVSGTTLGYTISTLTTYTGNTPQTGDAFARIGSTGSGLTSVAPASTALSTAQWTNARAGYLDNLNVGGNVSTYAGADTSGTTTLLSRLSALRAGYLDNLNVGGNVASHADAVALGSPMQAGTQVILASAGLDQIVGTSSQNMRQKIEIIEALVAGKLSGLTSATTGTATVRDVGDTRNIATVTFDANSNRTATTYSPPP